jgi:nucleotide-binding universal stress UspA family protein
MFKTIVVGTDGSETASAAVDRAAELAALCGAKVHLVCAYRNPMNIAAMAPETAAYVPSDADLKAHTKAVVDQAADQLRRRGVDVEAHACVGSAADAIITVAESQNADLVVVGSRGMTGARRLLGSVGNNVAHHAPCTVMIVHTD